MQVVLVILSVGLLGLIIYFAVSPKSSRLLRISALGALGLIALSLGICGFFLIQGPVEAAVEIPFPLLGEEAAEPAKKSNIVIILVFLAALMLVMGVITLIALRGRGKQGGAVKKVKADIPTTFGDIAAAASPFEAKKPIDDPDDESFDIELG